MHTRDFNTHAYAVTLIVTSSILFSTAGVFTKLSNWDPLAFTGVKCFVGLCVVCALRGWKRELERSTVIAGVGLVVGTLGFIVSTALGSAANAAVLLYTSPIFAALISWKLDGEKLRRSLGLAIAFVLLGMVLMEWGEFEFNLKADAIGLCGGVGLAVWTVYKKKQRQAKSLQSIVIGYAIASIVLVPFCLRPGMREIAGDLYSWTAAVLSGVAGALAFVCLAMAIRVKSLKSSEALVIMAFEVPLNVLLVFLGALIVPWRIEAVVPNLLAMTGMFLIVAAVLWYSLKTAWDEERFPGKQARVEPVEIECDSNVGV